MKRLIKASLTFLVTIMGYPVPQNPWRFETQISNASQIPECLYVPQCLRAGPLQHIKAGTPGPTSAFEMWSGRGTPKAFLVCRRHDSGGWGKRDCTLSYGGPGMHFKIQNVYRCVFIAP